SAGVLSPSPPRASPGSRSSSPAMRARSPLRIASRRAADAARPAGSSRLPAESVVIGGASDADGHAAVHEDDLSRDVGGVVGGQERVDAGDLVGTRDASDRDPGD